MSKKKTTEDDLDRALVEEAEREATAQLVIIRALGGLERGVRQRVLFAAVHLIEADNKVGGVLDAYLRGSAKKNT